MSSPSKQIPASAHASLTTSRVSHSTTRQDATSASASRLPRVRLTRIPLDRRISPYFAT